MRICIAVAIALGAGCSNAVDDVAGGGGDMSVAGGGNGGSGGSGGGGGSGGSGGAGGSGGWWKPTKSATLYWQLQNAPAPHDKNVGVYDVDGFDNDAGEVAALHGAGLEVVCYIDAGTWEPGRSDAKDFPDGLKGNGVQGWPGELWLDVRPAGPGYATLQAIMTRRFQMCRDKGFDAVEPDNIDSFDGNDPGFATSATDQLGYNRWIAATVHGLGMAVLQKNDLAQVDDLVATFDALLDEQCSEMKECPALVPYVTAGKPAWDVEYSAASANFCDAVVAAGIVGARYSIDLDGSLFEPCANDIGKLQ